MHKQAPHGEDVRNGRKKKRQRKAAQRREQAAQAGRLSVREIFRKLASALHPDREPNPEERERKTALMQEVNRAYEKNDLLTLLELQLKIEQIDTAALANTTQLEHYIHVLQEQLVELNTEVMRIRDEFRFRFGPLDRTPRPNKLGRISSELQSSEFRVSEPPSCPSPATLRFAREGDACCDSSRMFRPH